MSAPAPAGHAELVRRRTGLSIHVPGDLVTSTCRNLGWIALTLDAASHVTVRHHALSIAPRASITVNRTKPGPLGWKKSVCRPEESSNRHRPWR